MDAFKVTAERLDAAVAADALVTELHTAIDLIHNPSVWQPDQISQHLRRAIALRTHELRRRVAVSTKTSRIVVKPGTKWGAA